MYEEWEPQRVWKSTNGNWHLTQARTDLIALKAELELSTDSGLDLGQALKLVATAAQKHIGWYSILVRGVDRASSSLISIYHDGPEYLFQYDLPVQPIPGTMAAEVIKSAKPVLLSSGRTVTAPEPEVFTLHLFDRGVHSAFFSPVMDGEEVIAVVSLTGDRPDVHSEDQFEALSLVCEAVGSIIRRFGKLFIPSRDSSEDAITLDRISELVRFESYSEELFDKFSKLVLALIPLDRLSILLHIGEPKQVVTSFTSGIPMPPFVEGYRHSIPDDVASSWLAEMRAYVPTVTEGGHGYRVIHSASEIADSEFKSWIVAPVIWHGERIGDLHFRAIEAGVFEQRELDIANILADKLAGAVANVGAKTGARLELELRESLTQLSEMVSSTNSLSAIRDPFGELSTNLVGADRVSVTAWDYSARSASNLLAFGQDITGFEVSAQSPPDDPNDFRWFSETTPYVVNEENSKEFPGTSWSYGISLKAGLPSVLVAPVRWQGKPIAAITFRSRIENRFGVHEVGIAAAIASQIAGAIANHFALIEQKQMSVERATLANIGQIVTSAQSLEQVFNQFSEVANELVPTDRLSLTILEEGGDKPIRLLNHGRDLADLKPGELPPTVGQISAMLREKRVPMVVDESIPDAAEDVFITNRLAREVGLNSWLAAPLFWQNQLIGNLHFRSELVDAYGEQELRLAGEIAQQIAGAVAHSIAFAKLKAETKIQDVIGQIGRMFSSTTELSMVLPGVERLSSQIVGFDGFSIGAYFAERDTVRRLYASGIFPDAEGYVRPDSEQGAEFAVSSSASAVLLSSGEISNISASVRSDVEEFPQTAAAFDTGVRTFLTVPLISNDLVVGVVQLRSVRVDAFSDSDIEVVTRIAAQIAGALAINLASEQVVLQAAALAAADNAIVITSADGKIMWGNDALAHHTGWPIAELIGQYPNIWSSDDPSQFPIEEGLQDAIQAGKGWKGDHLNKRKDGTEFYEQLTITPVYDHAKILTHFVGIKQDITERILSEERRQRVAQVESENRELQGAAATRNEFLSTVSHELRTPLTTVSAFADILFNSRSENLTDRQRQHIELIRKSSRHLTELIDDLLSVTQTDSGQMILKMTEFDLSALLAEIVDSSNVWLTDRNQKLLLDDETANRGITADRTRLIQILSNLITNASKYSDQGEDITLSAKLSGDICEFSVSDQGIGISDNDQKLMFDAFFRGGQSLNKPGVGSGLGLTVVRSLVDLHDGAITVESQPGEGTNVTVSIPRVSR